MTNTGGSGLNRRQLLLEECRQANPEGFSFIDFSDFTIDELRAYVKHYEPRPGYIDPAYLDI